MLCIFCFDGSHHYIDKFDSSESFPVSPHLTTILSRVQKADREVACCLMVQQQSLEASGGLLLYVY